MKLYILFVPMISIGILKETHSQHRIDILNPLKSIESIQTKDHYVSTIYFNPEDSADYCEVHWENLYVDKIINYTKKDTAIFYFHKSKLLPIIYNNGTLVDMSLDKFSNVKSPCGLLVTQIGNGSNCYKVTYSPCKQQFTSISSYETSYSLPLIESGLHFNMKKNKLSSLYFVWRGEFYEFILRFNHKGKLKKKHFISR